MTHTYKVRDKMLITKQKGDVKAKLSQPNEGTYEILEVHRNGIVKTRRGSYDEYINIHYLKPYIKNIEVQ